MDTSEIVYNEDIYVPPSDNESDSNQGNGNFFVLQAVDENSQNFQMAELVENENIQDTDFGLYNLNDVETHSDLEDLSSIHPSEVDEPRSNATHTGNAVENTDENVNLENVYQNNRRINQPNFIFNVYDTDTESSESEDDTDNGNIRLEDDNSPETAVMTNYIGDEENLDDFADGWSWTNTDTEGSSSGPFVGIPGIQITPDGDTPLDYFKLFIPNRFIYRIKEETNLYANQNRQGKKYFIIYTSNDLFKTLHNLLVPKKKQKFLE